MLQRICDALAKVTILLMLFRLSLQYEIHKTYACIWMLMSIKNETKLKTNE